jgi:hypothetical protein
MSEEKITKYFRANFVHIKGLVLSITYLCLPAHRFDSSFNRNCQWRNQFQWHSSLNQYCSVRIYKVQYL